MNDPRAVFLMGCGLLAAGLPAQWGPVTTANAPAARQGALMAYDVLAQRMLLFGGNWTNEFWSYDGSTWTQLQLAVPPSRSRATWADDTFTGEIVLYGGDGGTGQFALDDTWTWDGTSWTLEAPATTPGGFARHAMAFDVTRQVTVMFGGRHNSFAPYQLSSDTWEYAQGTWSLVAPATQSPPALADMAMCYHPGLGKVVMFGGEDGAGLAHDGTWIYDGVDWQQTNATGVRPPARSGAVMVPIYGRGICMLFGGRDPVTMQILNDSWEYDGVTWTEITNVYGGVYPPRAEFAMAHDLARDRVVAFGGVIANNSLRDDTWEYGAHFLPFGLGCAGSAGVPVMNLGALPRLGTTCSVDIANLPPASPLAVMVIGLSRTQWALGSLPMQLTAFGMPGCRTYTSADLLVALPASGGTAGWSFAVPLVGGLVGDAYYLQGLSFDQGANPAWLTTSAAATLVLGN